jgi:hypothetical protein
MAAGTGIRVRSIARLKRRHEPQERSKMAAGTGQRIVIAKISSSPVMAAGTGIRVRSIERSASSPPGRSTFGGVRAFDCAGCCVQLAWRKNVPISHMPCL